MPKLSKKKIIIFFIIVLIGLIILFIFNNSFSVLQLNPFSGNKLNILIVGYDSSINGPPRADTIILSSLDLKTKEAGVLFVPRDTRVKVPEHGMDRVNASHAYGGIELAVQTVEDFLDVPIDYYVETDFQGFARIIDKLGGIKINIEKRLHYVDKAGGLYIDLPSGEQVLNGKEALQYVRFREPTFGDIGRVKRQQKFVYALMERVLQPGVIVKIPSIFNEVRKSVKTNIPLKDISPFVRLLKRMDIAKIKTTMVPGEPKYINGASYWIASREKLEAVVNTLIRSKDYIKNNQYYISIYNGNGEPGLAGKVADELEKYGFNIDQVSNAQNFNYKNTVIEYYNKKDKQIVANLQELIGGIIKYIDQDKQGLKIIIGSDYQL